MCTGRQIDLLPRLLKGGAGGQQESAYGMKKFRNLRQRDWKFCLSLVEKKICGGMILSRFSIAHPAFW
jgi:hypothetical protein